MVCCKRPTLLVHGIISGDRHASHGYARSASCRLLVKARIDHVLTSNKWIVEACVDAGREQRPRLFQIRNWTTNMELFLEINAQTAVNPLRIQWRTSRTIRGATGHHSIFSFQTKYAFFSYSWRGFHPCMNPMLKHGSACRLLGMEKRQNWSLTWKKSKACMQDCEAAPLTPEVQIGRR